MKFEHSSIPNYHKQGLVASVVMLFMICEGEKYCVGGLDMCHVGIGLGNGQTQVQEPSKRKPVGDFIWRLSHSRGGGIIKQ